MKYRSLFFAALLSLSVAGCSDESEDQQSGGASGPNGNQQRTEQHRESYQFVLNGCDTGKQDFSASTAADARRQLCEGLQDEHRNKGCAVSLRRDLFAQKCAGNTWSTGQPGPGRPSDPPPSIDPQPHPDPTARWVLRHVLVKDYRVAEGLEPELRKSSTRLSEDMMACGLSHAGPKCLDYNSMVVAREGEFFEQGQGGGLFVTDMRLNGWKQNLLLAFTIQDLPQAWSEELVVYLRLKDKLAHQSISEYLSDKTSVRVISKLRILTRDIRAEALQRLHGSIGLRELYHLSDLLKALEAQSGQADPELNQALIERFEKNRGLISGASETAYLYAAYEFFERLRPGVASLIELAQELFKVGKEEIKQFAATHILALDPSRVDLKPWVLGALDHASSSTRIKAIRALAAVSLDAGEKNKVLMKMEDRDFYVREAAYTAANGLMLDESQVPALKKLMASSDTSPRKNAAKLLGKLTGQAAQTALIESMSDPDFYVREEVFAQLDRRSFTNLDLPALSKQMQSQFTSTRQTVAKLMGKVDSDLANNSLIAGMSDQDFYVRESIEAILRSKTLNEQNVAELERQLGSQFTSVRSEVAGLLGKIGSAASLKILVGAMSDSDFYVRENISKILESKPLGGEFVASLSQEFSSKYSSVRQSIARLLGKIRTQESLNALRARLAVETDFYVKEQIKQSINELGTLG